MTELAAEATIAGEELWEDRLRAAAERIRASRTLDKSAYLNRLFDFLVVRTLAGEPPKELEIAHEVYNIPLDGDSGLDATVRVSVHRLRKKLDEFPIAGLTERLLLPRGGYRLVLAPIEQPAPSPTAPENESQAPDHGRPAWRRFIWLVIGAVGALLCMGLFAALRPIPAHASDPRLASVLWAPLSHSALPTILVVGDHYTVGETDGRGKVVRLIQVPEIVSQQTLDAFNGQSKGSRDNLIDLNYYELPAAAAPALAAILPLADAAVAHGSANLTTEANSRFDTDALSGHNIIYIGLLSGLRDLRDPVFETSGFTLSPSGDALVDRASQRAFQSNWSDLTDNQILARDYAYLASLPGPSGNRMIVIAGTRDPAFAEAAQIASSAAKLAALGRQVGNAPAFEALYEVRTFGPSNYASRLILARPMRIQHGW